MANLEAIIDEVDDEFGRAQDKFGSFNSAHEGYAILLEEVDELWYEIKHGTPEAARTEAIQVAAMAIRLVHDVYPEGSND